MTARDCMDVFVNELNGPIQQLAILRHHFVYARGIAKADWLRVADTEKHRITTRFTDVAESVTVLA